MNGIGGAYNAAVIDTELFVSLLRPEATRRETISFCERVVGKAVPLVLPAWVADALDTLEETGTAVSTVIGWPYGAAPAQALGVEAAMAAADGAQHLFFCPNLSALKSGAELLVADALQSVVDAAAPAEVEVTLWLPWEQLKPLERQSLVRVAVECGATGFLLPVADTESATALREFLDEEIGVLVLVSTGAEASAMEALGASALLLPEGSALAQEVLGARA